MILKTFLKVCAARSLSAVPHDFGLGARAHTGRLSWAGCLSLSKKLTAEQAEGYISASHISSSQQS